MAFVWLGHGAALALEIGPITAPMRADDPRLEQRLSVRAGRWYVGALCERMADITEGAVVANERDGAADPRVIAILRDITLADAMNALRPLLSYKDAPYIWDRYGDAPANRYVLRRSLNAQRLAAEVDARIQADFEAECAKLLRLSRLNNDDLKELARDDAMANNMVRFPRVAEAWRMLGDSLSSDMLNAVLRGAQTLTLTVADLPASGQRFVTTVWSEGQHTILTPEGGRAEAPEPKTIRVQVDHVGPSAAPVLVIGLPHAGGYGYAGGLPLLRRLSIGYLPAWILPADRARDPREDAVLPRPSFEPSDQPQTENLAWRLTQLARAARISVFCRLSHPYDAMQPPAPYGQVLSDWIDALGRQRALMQTKWQSDTLLISSSGWITHDADQTTWRTEKALRKSLRRKDGMTFQEVAALAASMTDQQALTIGADHPSLAFLRKPGLYAALGQAPDLISHA
ncbi:MAG: hypothetical protein HUU17_01715 [Chthonomonadales bacterium]|nr:hypothetical protein [Chthonomonadales bacterium]